jgi:hypothetical protein
MTFTEWAQRWNIPASMVEDYHANMMEDISFADSAAKSETGVQKRERLRAAHAGGILWRNNVGVLTNDRGTPVRYGLANDSKAMNKKIKSSDLIGITPIVVTPAMVGTRVGIFTAKETKAPGWHYTGTEREQAQCKYLDIVIAAGGIGGFVS